jgi:hypothetical protein
MRYDFVQESVGDNPYVGVPGIRKGSKADHLLVIRQRTGRSYRRTIGGRVVMVGDSHLDINASRSAGPSAQLAHFIGQPVGVIWQPGLSADAPVRLASDRLLRKRRVVILHYTERMMSPGSPEGKRWPVIDLPGAADAAAPKRAAAPSLEGLPASCVVAQVSAPPDPKSPYPHYVMKLYVKDLGGFLGKVGTGDGVLHILAMHNRKVLPVAAAKPGDKLRVTLTSWSAVEKKYGRLRSGSLEDVQLELGRPLYWAETGTTPKLTEDDLARAAGDEPGGDKP